MKFLNQWRWLFWGLQVFYVDPPGGGGPPDPKPDPAAQLAAALAKIAELEAAAKAKPNPDDDDQLHDKARKQREKDSEGAAHSRRLEAALSFSLKSSDFLKTNEALLPKDVSEIFKHAEKETYADKIEKDCAIKSSIVQSFFAVQANVDMLTASQKAQLDDYLKLTKTVKQERAQEIYDALFEPTLEAIRREKKAQALQKGHGPGDDNDYKKRLMEGSRKYYLRETV